LIVHGLISAPTTDVNKTSACKTKTKTKTPDLKTWTKTAHQTK